MLRARIEQRRGTRHVLVRGDQAIELHRFLHRARETAAHAQEKLLWCLQGFACFWMTQQVAVVDSPQAKVLEQFRTAFLDCVVQLARIFGDKKCQLSRDQPLLLPGTHRLREGMNILIGDSLAMKPSSSLAASFEYSGSSAI